MGERKVFSTRLDQDVIKQLKHLAVDLGRPLNDLIEQAIRDLLEKHKKSQQPTLLESTQAEENQHQPHR